ncbi:probable splicing factor, arginine/serine-rich 7 isoform X2 [Vespula pensylvanica]|uniref:probable splicing factor, arginine/serine-rich 7 isoform X2 n=1 Tax=Vespula pensylvanica TaxID=30213 RepID=UPI001CBA3494|nr:probable splicing factor, arginine/serine-rich 7 isoform X2 [Vespula pensylvanica]
MAVGSTKVVQVTNIAPQATKDQMQTLFGYLGKIEDIRLYPTIRDVAVPVQSRICYVKFHDQGCVAVAQHMTNTVFIDRALIVIPYQNGDIPDEQRALELTNNGTVVPGLYPSEPKLPPNVVNAIEGIPPNHVITTMDPKLEAHGLPPYPHLPGHLDSRRIEEIRRTLVIANLDASTTAEQLLDFFSNNNVEIKYLRLCTRDSDTDHYALVELTEQGAVVSALLLNGKMLGDRHIKIYHSTQAIAKPEAKNPMIGMLSKDKRSRSGSRSRKSRSRSRGRSRRSRSRKRSRSRHRRRSRSRSKRSRSKERRRKSPSRRRSSSRSRHRSRSRSRRSRSRRSRSRSRDRRKRSLRRRSRSHSRSKRSKSKSRRSRSKSKSRSSKSRYSEKYKDKDKDRNKDKSDNGKKSDGDKGDKEKSEKKSSKEKKSEKESKSDEKNRVASENNENKDKESVS